MKGQTSSYTAVNNNHDPCWALPTRVQLPMPPRRAQSVCRVALIDPGPGTSISYAPGHQQHLSPQQPKLPTLCLLGHVNGGTADIAHTRGYDFSKCTWVADLVGVHPEGEAAAAAAGAVFTQQQSQAPVAAASTSQQLLGSTGDQGEDDDEVSYEDLPQGYRTADRVTVFRVAVDAEQVAKAAAAAPPVASPATSHGSSISWTFLSSSSPVQQPRAATSCPDAWGSGSVLHGMDSGSHFWVAAMDAVRSALVKQKSAQGAGTGSVTIPVSPATAVPAKAVHPATTAGTAFTSLSSLASLDEGVLGAGYIVPSAWLPDNVVAPALPAPLVNPIPALLTTEAAALVPALSTAAVASLPMPTSPCPFALPATSLSLPPLESVLPNTATTSSPTSTSSSASPSSQALARSSSAEAPSPASVPRPSSSPDPPPRTSRLVAVKVSRFRDRESGEMDSFKMAASLNEWDMYQRYSHAFTRSRNLVQLLGWSKTRDSISIVSEYCRYGDLQRLLDRRRQLLEKQQARRAAAASATEENATAGISGSSSPAGLGVTALRHISFDVLQGLASLHDEGLTHGDVKPANVFMARASRKATNTTNKGVRVTFKLGDYGTTREKDRRQLHYFVQGFGYSPEYASPEVLKHGTGAAGVRSDVWSCGILMLQLLLGRLPQVALQMEALQDASHHSARAAWLKANPPSQSALAELQAAGVTVAPALAQLLEACLQVDPHKRAPSARALLQADFFK